MITNPKLAAMQDRLCGLKRELVLCEDQVKYAADELEASTRALSKAMWVDKPADRTFDLERQWGVNRAQARLSYQQVLKKLKEDSIKGLEELIRQQEYVQQEAIKQRLVKEGKLVPYSEAYMEAAIEYLPYHSKNKIAHLAAKKYDALCKKALDHEECLI